MAECLGSQPTRHRSARSRGTRRPDKAIYVPRALRQKACESLSSDQHNRSSSSYCLSTSEEFSSDNAEPPPPSEEAEFYSADQSVVEPDVFSGSGMHPWPPTWDQTVSYFMAMGLEDRAEEECSNTARADSPCQNKDETDDFYSEVPNINTGSLTFLIIKISGAFPTAQGAVTYCDQMFFITIKMTQT